MQKKIKILFCGLGSAGQRHLRILKKNFSHLGLDIYCFRKTNRNIIIKDNLKIFKVKSVKDYYNLKSLDKKISIMMN